ncbi:MAG: hypothetical protein ACK559_25790, partial [bacterium]
PAAHAAGHADDQVVALGLEQPVVAAQHRRVRDAGRGGGTRLGGAGQLGREMLLARRKVGELTVGLGLQCGVGPGGDGHLRVGRLDALHQVELLVLEPGDLALASLDLVLVGLVLVVAPGLVLL